MQKKRKGRDETETIAKDKTVAHRSDTNPAIHLPHQLANDKAEPQWTRKQD